VTSKRSNQGQIAPIGNTLKIATAACSIVSEQVRHIKCIKHQYETTSKESIGDAKFDLDLMVKVIWSPIAFQQPVAPYWSKIDM